jgi:hypothetical protein
MSADHLQQLFGTVVGLVPRSLINANSTDRNVQQPPAIEGRAGKLHAAIISPSSSFNVRMQNGCIASR